MKPRGRITLAIDPRHWPWLARHAPRLGYAGPADYANAILNMALIAELDAHDEFLRVAQGDGRSEGPDDLDDALPF